MLRRLLPALLVGLLLAEGVSAAPEPVLRLTCDPPGILQVAGNRALRLDLDPATLAPGRAGRGLRLQADATNLLPPGYADPDADLLGQLALDLASAELQTGAAVAGKSALRLDFEGPGGYCGFPQLSLTQTKGDMGRSVTFVLSAWLRAEGQPVKVKLAVTGTGTNAAKKETQAAAETAADLPAGQWKRVAVVLSLPADSIQEQIGVALSSESPGGARVLVDALQLERGDWYPQYHTSPTDWLPGGQSRALKPVTFPLGDLPMPMAEGTIAVWARVDPWPSGTTPGEVTWFSVGRAWARGWELSNTYAMAGGTTLRFGSLLPKLADGAFHHLALTWDQEALAAYLDGQQVGRTKLVTSPPSTADQVNSFFCLLGTHSPRRRTCQGTLDDFIVYDRALSTDELSALAQDKQAPPTPLLLAFPKRYVFTRSERQANLTMEVINAPSNLNATASGIPSEGAPRTFQQGERTFLTVPVAPHKLKAGPRTVALRLNAPGGPVMVEQKIEIVPAYPVSDYGVSIWAGPLDPASLELYRDTGVRILDVTEWTPPVLNRLGQLGYVVSAHYNNWHPNPHPVAPENWAAMRENAQTTAAALAEFPWVKFSLVNTEMGGTDDVTTSPLAMKLLKQELGLDQPPLPPGAGWDDQYLRPKLDLTKFANTGRVPTNHPELRYLAWLSEKGNGLPLVNGEIASILRAARPGLRVLQEPANAGNWTYGYTSGGDIAGSWCYAWTLPALFTRFDFPRAAARYQKGQMYPILGGLYVPEARVKQADGSNPALSLSADKARAELWVASAQPGELISIWLYDLRNKKEFLVQPGLYETYAEVIKTLNRIGPIYGNVPLRKPSVAVLASFTTLAGYGKERYWHWYGGLIYGVLNALHGASLPVDLVYEQDLRAGTLSQYRTLVMPATKYLPEDVYAAIEKWSAAGGVVIADQMTNPAYQFKNVQLIASLEGDLVKGNPTLSGALAEWAASYRTDDPATYADTGGQAILTQVKEAWPAKYVYVINDKWAPGLGEAVGLLDKGVPQDVTVRLREQRAVVVYDVVARQKVATMPGPGGLQFPAHLEPGEGKLYAVYPFDLKSITLAPPAAVTRGQIVTVPVTLLAENGAAMPGRMGLEVEVRDAAGALHDESGIYPVTDGKVAIELRPALEDPPGTWTITCTDAAGSLKGTTTVTVK